MHCFLFDIHWQENDKFEQVFANYRHITSKLGFLNVE